MLGQRLLQLVDGLWRWRRQHVQVLWFVVLLVVAVLLVRLHQRVLQRELRIGRRRGRQLVQVDGFVVRVLVAVLLQLVLRIRLLLLSEGSQPAAGQ